MLLQAVFPFFFTFVRLATVFLNLLFLKQTSFSIVIIVAVIDLVETGKFCELLPQQGTLPNFFSTSGFCLCASFSAQHNCSLDAILPATKFQQQLGCEFLTDLAGQSLTDGCHALLEVEFLVPLVILSRRIFGFLFADAFRCIAVFVSVFLDSQRSMF